jgi:hypothetical protein
MDQGIVSDFNRGSLIDLAPVRNIFFRKYLKKASVSVKVPSILHEFTVDTIRQE